VWGREGGRGKCGAEREVVASVVQRGRLWQLWGREGGRGKCGAEREVVASVGQRGRFWQVWGRGGGPGGYFIEGRRGGRGYTVDATSSLILIY
jgi:hypothetical protein